MSIICLLVYIAFTFELKFFRHTKEMIKKLDSAGLGFYTKSFQTKERLGKVFMASHCCIVCY